MSIELFAFWHSHYCEKARWALDLTGADYTERCIAPGPHLRTIKRLSGQTATPVIRDGERVVAGSTAIIEHLDGRQPEPTLLPVDPEARAAALDAIAWWDDKLGPGIRRCALDAMMTDRGYFTRTMGRAISGPVGRASYAAFSPILMALMRKGMNIRPAAVERGIDMVRQGLDRAAEAGDGFLFGDAFSAVDLTAAALLNPAVGAPEGVRMIERPPPALEAWYARWADHPGAAWVRRIYRDHRPHPIAA